MYPESAILAYEGFSPAPNPMDYHCAEMHSSAHAPIVDVGDFVNPISSFGNRIGKSILIGQKTVIEREDRIGPFSGP